MKRSLIKIAGIMLIILVVFSCKKDEENEPLSTSAFFDHTCTDLNAIPTEWINAAKQNLHIAYAHTSHGSQLIDGMSGLETWKGAQYAWHDGPLAGSLDIDDYFVDGDLGNPDRTTWEQRTRDYLATHTDVNVVMWSWCGQASSASETDINTYLGLMSGLETDYPNIKFVYMTGHLDGTGVAGNLNVRNEQIRRYCKDNNKYLYDFADIESWDPDGNYYLDKDANADCSYDSDGNGSNESNWAISWQNSHTQNVDWYNCGSEHSYPINANRKAYAAWWLWARLAGWDGK